MEPSLFRRLGLERGLRLMAWLRSASAAFVGASLLLATAGLVGGCAYQLGPSSGAEPGARSIAILPFENETLEPRVTEPMATALRAQFQQEGTFHVARQSDADIILSGTVVDIHRVEESFQTRDVRVLRDYRLEITAQVTAIERGSGRKLLDERVEGHTTMRVQSDLASAERQAMPLLAANLARNIVSRMVDGSW